MQPSHYLIICSMLLFACQSTPKPKPQSISDDKLEGGDQVMKPKEALTKSFSYRQLRWGTDEKNVRFKLGDTIAEYKKEKLKLLTFPSKTRGIPTVVTTGLIENQLVTLDITIQDKAQCEDALPKWIDALSLKYGGPTESKDTYVLWKLEEGSRIVIEGSGACSILYAKSALQRKKVNLLAP